MIDKKAEVVIGTLCLADDMATVAELEEEEEVQAKRILTETTQDWEEK